MHLTKAEYNQGRKVARILPFNQAETGAGVRLGKIIVLSDHGSDLPCGEV